MVLRVVVVPERVLVGLHRRIGELGAAILGHDRAAGHEGEDESEQAHGDGPAWYAKARVRTLEVDGRTALLERPRGARHLLVLAHGAGAGMRHAFMVEIAGALAARGVATLRWEFPYMAAGKARVDRADVAEAAVRATVDDAARRIRGLTPFAGGKSFGGRMTSQAHAARALPVRGLVFFGFPLHPPDAPATTRAEHLPRTTGPLLFLQGTRDDLADLALLAPIARALGPRAMLHVVEGADHGFDVLVRSGRTHDQVLAELADTTAAWMDRVSLS